MHVHFPRILYVPFTAAVLACAMVWQPSRASVTAPQVSPVPVWGDLDGDGRPDQVVIQRGADTSRIEVLASGPYASQTFSTNSAASTVIAVDIDGDGDLDLITASPTGSELWLNDGHGVFTPGRVTSQRILSAPATFDVTRVADLVGLTVSAPRIESIVSSPHDRVAFVRAASQPMWLSWPLRSSTLLRAPPAVTMLV
jgi:hypothetical protein